MTEEKASLVGPVVQALYDRDGETFGHHVRETEASVLDRTALGRAGVTSARVHQCVDHLITNCIECGRTPGEHDDYVVRFNAGAETVPLDHEHTPRPPCGCDLEKGDSLP